MKIIIYLDSISQACMSLPVRSIFHCAVVLRRHPAPSSIVLVIAVRVLLIVSSVVGSEPTFILYIVSAKNMNFLFVCIQQNRHASLASIGYTYCISLYLQTS